MQVCLYILTSDYLTNKYLWGVNEKPIFIGKAFYKLSTMREKTFGLLMLSRGALYVFTNPTMKKPSLRLHINLLQCQKIKCQQRYLYLKLPPLRIKTEDIKNDENSDYDYSNLPLPLPGMTIANPEDENVRGEEASLVIEENVPDEEGENEDDEDFEKMEASSEKSENEKGSPKSEKGSPKSEKGSPKSEKGSPKSKVGEKKNKEITEKAFMEDEKPEKKKKGNKRKDLNQVTLLIDSKSYSPYLYKWMYRILKTSLWRTKNVVRPILYSKGIQIKNLPDKRVKHSLKRRAVLLAHYCFGSGESLECADYFQAKWDGEPNLVIGPSFHPGGYAVPFGCAVGLEASLKTVMMKNSHFKYFSAFLSSILNAAETIKTVGIKDYQRGKSFPIKFNVKQTIVDEWVIINCCSDMVKSFALATKDLPSPIRALTIAKHSYNKDDAASVFQSIASSNNLRKMSNLTFSALNFKSFPKSSFASLCSSLENLEELEISRINIDGSIIFVAACRDAPKIRKLYLRGLKFELEWNNDNVKLPVTLALLNISETCFFGPSFASFLKNITLKEVKVPFFFVAHSLQFSESVFIDFKSRIDYSQCKSNILEFDMSNNMIPRVAFDPIFDFLNTQKRLRNVIFNEIVTDDQHNFVHKLSFVNPGPLFAGIDFSGQFRPIIIQQFISSVPGSSGLRRLCMRGLHAGNKGFELIQNLLNILKSINEIEIDEFQPEVIPSNHRVEGERHPIIECWKKIMKHKSISANNLPIADMASLGFVIKKLPDGSEQVYEFDERLIPEDREMFEHLSPPFRSIPTTINDRLNYLIENMKNGNKIGIQRAISPNVFIILNKNIPLDQEIEEILPKQTAQEATEETEDGGIFALDDDDDDDLGSFDGSLSGFSDDSDFDDTFSENNNNALKFTLSSPNVKMNDDKAGNEKNNKQLTQTLMNIPKHDNKKQKHDDHHHKIEKNRRKDSKHDKKSKSHKKKKK
ncbi:hypothetical protein TRFO_13808 [Tritrichomonas foetus]|uniref:Uncharacterized protein n=1 Tax=Tritrichomonas foetus TaxID=1144522 RepID=A0A1J4KX37_9EUKA|nr:hypothetical protein TRFO_13808 [Tritrichomonas foetus]|eukprot:OHT15799.1 hypothetical protein TRFO_13808 [Tritrichomonas foetus]